MNRRKKVERSCVIAHCLYFILIVIFQYQQVVFQCQQVYRVLNRERLALEKLLEEVLVHARKAFGLLQFSSLCFDNDVDLVIQRPSAGDTLKRALELGDKSLVDTNEVEFVVEGCGTASYLPYVRA